MQAANRIGFISVLLVFSFIPIAAYAYGDIGGDDVPIFESLSVRNMSMDIASNGDIYAACQYDQPSGLNGIAVYRSQDDGTTWDLWGALTTAAGMGDSYMQPCLQVVEGVVEKCYLAYTHASNLFVPRIMMVSSDLAGTQADFTSPVTVMSSATLGHAKPRFDTDVNSFDSFYIYLVAEEGTSGTDIAFTRSLDQGATFETSYLIGTLAPTDRDYQNPDVSYGFGGFVNVVWDFVIDDGTFDGALRYRRAANSAHLIGNWTSIYGLGSTSDGVGNQRPRIEASATGTEVVIVCENRSAVKNAQGITDPGVYISDDSGLTYATSTTIPDGVFTLGDIEADPTGVQWTLCGWSNDGMGIHRANVADLSAWSAVEVLADRYYDINGDYTPDLALNAAQGYRPAMVWQDNNPGLVDNEFMVFDGEWRGDPGYPNLEPGFPLRLEFESLSAPAVVDVDGDGDLEIVFGDKGGNIQVFRKDGTALPGWPVNIGEDLSATPVAVGDLKGHGTMSIVAGSASGRVYLFDADGSPAAGNWPFDEGDASPAYVAVGAFGRGPYARGIVVHTGRHGYFLDHKGNLYPDTILRTFAQDASQAPAIGDVDGDGLPDVAFSQQAAISVTTIFDFRVIFGGYLPADISGALTMGDFDLNGDQEIVMPLADGTLHVYDADGSDIPGFPFNSPPGTRLSTAALGQFLGTSEPEIAIASRSYQVHVLWFDGVEGSGWPASTEGWANYGSPVIGRVDGSSSDVVMGSRGFNAWAWNNFGGVIPGWPKIAKDNFYLAPAMGDIDLDGSTEIVLVSSWYLYVMDINQVPATASRTWPMAGHDPQRTGCSDCPEDVTTPVEDDLGTVTRVSFAPPSPNPSSGSANFRFAVPGPAVVNLEVFDVRGHRVSLVTREEVGMGSHVATWNGRDNSGAPLASGIYFARLRVNGPGISEEVTRKVTLAR